MSPNCRTSGASGLRCVTWRWYNEGSTDLDITRMSCNNRLSLGTNIAFKLLRTPDDLMNHHCHQWGDSGDNMWQRWLWRGGNMWQRWRDSGDNMWQRWLWWGGGGLAGVDMARLLSLLITCESLAVWRCTAIPCHLMLWLTKLCCDIPPPTARYRKVSQLSTRYCQALATSWVGIEGQLIFIRPDDWCSECSEYKCENRRTSVEMQKFDDYCNDLDESVKITNIDELHSSSFPILWG